MVSKEEAESKLLKVFYVLEMEKLYNVSPNTAEINIFESTSDPEHLEHNWYIDKKEDKICIQMTALDYEKGAQYVSGNFAFLAALRSSPGFIFKRWGLIKFLSIVLIIGFDMLGIFLIDFSMFFVLIPLLAIGGILFLFFSLEKIRKSRLDIEYLNNLHKISDQFETKSLQKYYKNFFSLYTKTFLSSVFLILVAGLSVLGFIGKILI